MLLENIFYQKLQYSLVIDIRVNWHINCKENLLVLLEYLLEGVNLQEYRAVVFWAQILFPNRYTFLSW